MKRIRSILVRPPGRRIGRLAAGLLVALWLGVGYTQVAAHQVHLAAAAGSVPKLTADTNAGCNRAVPKGQVRCLSIVRTPSSHVITPTVTGPPAGALGPADIQSAYHLPGGGSGQTVAIVDAFGDANAEQDLAAFRAQYGLAACTTANGCFRKTDQAGGTSYPADDPGWGLETSLDLDAVSAACPQCNILLVESDSDQLSDMGAAEDEAVALGAKFISNSYGSVDDPSEAGFDSSYDHAGVAIVVSTGDTGGVIQWPSSNPHVTAAGGTTLTRDASASRGWAESAWGDTTQGDNGSGDGCSSFEPQPDFQAGLATDCSNRATADVAADADPQTGLAVYDTLGEGGWLQVGGTSLAAPLITAINAMAGTPQPGTYPVTGLYHDPDPAADLFDVTAGSAGPCGTVLCTAGPGWDGPTGLGTPDGLGAFTSRPQGVITGTVTGAADGKPVQDVIVTASPGGYQTHTGADGAYTLDAAAGSYTVTASKYLYKTGTDTGVSVTAGGTVTADFSLTGLPTATVSGTVTDGSGHGWPLYAQISIDGYPGGPVYTDPYTGRYSVTLAASTSYTVHVVSALPSVLTPDGGGYQPLEAHFDLGTTGTAQDFKLTVDTAACTAPGYGATGLAQSFTNWAGATPAAGWTITGAGWRFDDPGNRPPPSLTGGDDSFAVADSAASGPLHTVLTSPVIDLTGQAKPQLSFDSGYYGAPGQRAAAEVSTDGGRTWTAVWKQGAAYAAGHVTVPLPRAAGMAGVRVRFSYDGTGGGWWWAVDQVAVGTSGCAALPGALLAGQVSDHAAGTALTGATITAAADPSVYGVSAATAQPDRLAGFYELFSPLTGTQSFTAAAPGYTPASATAVITAGQLTRHDWALTQAGG